MSALAALAFAAEAGSFATLGCESRQPGIAPIWSASVTATKPGLQRRYYTGGSAKHEPSVLAAIPVGPKLDVVRR
jgi:hypothetical protein